MLNEAKELAQLIESSLPEKIEIAALSLNSKLPFKALSLRELLIHRVANLATPAVELFEHQREVSAILLTRGVIETVAIMFALHRALTTFLDNHDVPTFDHFLMQSLMGSRLPDASHQAKNIVTLIQHVEKTIPGFESVYNSLSEYAHPNWAGVLGSFGKIDHEAFELRLGRNQRASALKSGVAALSGSLMTCHHFYNDMVEMLYAMNAYFEGPDGSHAKEVSDVRF